MKKVENAKTMKAQKNLLKVEQQGPNVKLELLL